MLISQGTSRYVYDIGNGFVKKIPIDKHGIWQNESEIRIHNNNIDNDLILHIEDYDKNGEWVVQRKCNPLSENTTYLFKELTDANWEELCELTHSVRKMLRAHKKKGEDIHTTYTGDSEFLHKFEKYLIDNNINFFEDFRDPTNWGIFDGKIYLIDYGMDSITYKKYISRDEN
jgi:hypothetical protein